MKKYLCLVLILLNLYLPILMVSKIEAASVSTSFYTNVRLNGNAKAWALRAFAYIGGITTTVTKTINFVLPNGATASTQSNLNIGESIALSQNSTSASWFQSGGWDDSPNSDGQWYQVFQHQFQRVCTRLVCTMQRKSDFDTIFFLESLPSDQSWVNITSSNPSVLECNATWGCTAKNPGYATIIVNFPQNELNGNNERFLSGASGFGIIKIAAVSYRNGQGQKSYDMISAPYSFPAMYYGVTVAPRPNQNAVASCLPPTNMSPRGGTFNWKYTDAEGDAQSNYHFQLATDPSFTNIIYQTAQSWGNGGMTTTGGSVVIPNGTLFPGVTYYTRIASYNGVNGWGAYFQNCSENFTTLPIPQPTEFITTCSDSGNQLTVKWVNPDGYDNIYFRATDVTVHPDITLADALNRIWDKFGLYPELFNEEVQGNSYTFDTIPGHEYLLWIHTKDKNITDPKKINYSPPLFHQTLRNCPSESGICATDSQGKQIRDRCATEGVATEKIQTEKQYTWKCPSSDPLAPPTSCSIDINPPDDALIDTNRDDVEPCLRGGWSCNKEDSVPLISIGKYPYVVLDKNGLCFLEWVIQALPDNASCSLSGLGVDPVKPSIEIATSSNIYINNLQSSQRYTITCSGPSLTSQVSHSVICRVNPEIREN